MIATIIGNSQIETQFIYLLFFLRLLSKFLKTKSLFRSQNGGLDRPKAILSF